MSLTLEELIQNRIDLIEAHRKNNFTDGIHALLTDLYPDTAHFIYELLQNAEDMEATVVRFILEKTSIDFEHNGTKRNFNIADIDAITNIGHNRQKKDDPTSIGKFGVGFKAVFAYTSTPIIHSGKYHFKIKDYFVPDFEGIKKISTIDSTGLPLTTFSFPFNNPKKPPNTAYNECLGGLFALDASAVLFLQNIRTIEYMLPSGELGYVKRVDDDGGDYHVSVIYKNPNEQHEHKSRWLRFDRIVDITDDQGNQKKLSISVAFALDYDAKNKKERIVPVPGGGRTFIYFPAEKEYSGLRFHINAPFASTVARDSVRNCVDNNKLIKAISELICDSLPTIKEQGLMNHSFFEVLPNNKDQLSVFYQYIFDYVYSAFQKNAYLPAREGDYTTAKSGLIGPASISNVFRNGDMQTLFSINKVWVQNATQKNSHADNFIQSLDIQNFSFKDFSRIFEPSCKNKTESFLLSQSLDWLKKFYTLCADTYEYLDYSSKDIFVRNMRRAVAIRSSKGEMLRSTDIFILPVNVPLITKATPIVDQSLIHASSKTDKVCDKIRSFFHDELEIREYGPKVEIEKLLASYDNMKSFEVDDQYFRDLLTFAKYKEEHKDIDFSTHPIFLCLDTEGNALHAVKASEIFLGKAYGNDAGEILAPIYGMHCLWTEYRAHFREKELQQFISFVNACGIQKGLRIEQRSAYWNPLYSTELDSFGRRTGYGSSYDYNIPDLEKLLKVQSLEISKIIWNTLEKYGKSRWDGYDKAAYSPNASAPTKKCDSTFIYWLKQYAWIPNKQGKLFKPEDISLTELHKDFVFNPENYLLAALKIGSAAAKQSQELAKLEQAAKKAGQHLVTEDDYKLLQQYKKQLEASKSVPQLSGQDLLDKQKKRAVKNVNSGDDFSTDGAVYNVSRRETNIEATFRNAKQMNQSQRKLFGRITESSKEERNLLRNWYQGKCQMCNTVIIGYNQSPHFIAKNIISTQHLSASIRQTTSLAWNSLCLCPNCAAKYDVCSRDLNGLYEQIMQTEVIEGDPERIVLSIELAGKRQEIRYIPKHFLALKKVMELIEKETTK